MEKWESFISSYPTNTNVQGLGKALQAASVVLKEDVAPFEIEWILQTLLMEPVSLLSVISMRSSDYAWTKPVSDTFKLLADIVDLHPSYLEPYFEDLVKLCQASYDAQIRKLAVQCLTSVVKHSPIGVADARRHVLALQEMPTCRAPTALLVGAICEHHPELVADEAAHIWRIYLNLLDCNKNTDTVIQAVLVGISGLLKHFGCDLPTAELMVFYDNLSRDYIKKAKCEKVSHTILHEYGGLFKEMMIRDKELRAHLWATLGDWNVAGVLRSVYAAIATVATASELEDLISEVTPHCHSRKPQEQLTAFWALTSLGSHRETPTSSLRGTPASPLQGTPELDVYSLEARLKNGEGARMLSFCIETNAPNCDKLVQTAIMFYDKIPSWDKTVVTHALLNAAPELRNTAVLFLTAESCRDSTSLNKFLPIWEELFNSQNGRDNVVVEKCQFVFEDFMKYFITTLDGILLDPNEDEHAKYLSLLTLSSHVLTLQCPEEYTRVNSAQAYELLVRMNDGSIGPLLAAARAIVPHLEGWDFGGLYEALQIDRCRDEALLCECCLTLIQAPEGYGDVDNILQAMQIIFSRTDAEPKMLSSTLNKLETMIVQQKCSVNQEPVVQIIHLVEKLRKKSDMINKDSRILRKDITMFLGKYSAKTDIINNQSMEENNLIAELKDALTLSILDPNEARIYKINLQTIVQAAIEHGDPDALQTVMVIICANLSSSARSSLLVLCAVHAAAECVSLAAIHQALLLARQHQPLLEYISQEKYPGVRRMLTDALEGLLMKDPGSEANDQMMTSIGDHVLVMMASDDSTARRAGLDITESLTVCLYKNNQLTAKYLPNILILISDTYEVNADLTFDKASTLFEKRIELFDLTVIDKLIVDLFKNLLVSKRINIKKKLHIYRKITKSVLLFVKRVFDKKNYVHDKILEILKDIFEEKVDIVSFYVLAVSKTMFDFNNDSSRELLSHKDFLIAMCMFQIIPSNEHHFGMESILKFLQEYAVLLTELHYQKSLQYIGDLISGLQTTSIKYVHKTLSTCLTTYKEILKKYPQIILNSLEKYTESLPLQQITDHIEKDVFLSDHGATINALKLTLSAFDTELSFLTAVKIHARKWPRIILQLFSREDDLTSKMSYLTDLLTVALKFVTVTDVKRLILEGSCLKGVSNEKIGVQFCKQFMEAFYSYLVDRRILLDDDMAPVCMVLNDIVKFYIRRGWQEEDCGGILALVDGLWSTYANHTTFDQKYGLLLDLSCLPEKLGSSSGPYQWASGVVAARECVGAVCLLPGGEEYSSAYRSFAESLPSRLSELAVVQHSFRALLEALATTGDRTLLHIVASLANGDDTPGWWDESLDACMASLAVRGEPELPGEVWKLCQDGLALGACRRLMVPLLRYSPQSVCVEFFKNTDLLSMLRKVQREAAPTYAYHKTLADYTRAFSVLQVAFEKISPQQLAPLPPSQAGRAWGLVRDACKLSVTLRDTAACPAAASRQLRGDWRIFQCAAYSCLTAAIVARKPAEPIYNTIFDPKVWENMVDNNLPDLPLRARWYTARSGTVEAEPGSPKPSAGSLRSRLFLRTLSENPLLFDLYKVSEEDAPQLQPLPSTTILRHECNEALYICLCHITTLEYRRWREVIVATLTGTCSVHVKWLIAQAIVNCKEELKVHSSVFRPPLLALVADTATDIDGKKLLNGLHMDVLDTLSLWREEVDLSTTSRDHLNTIIKCLITTILENRRRTSVYKSLVEDLGRFLEVYCSCVTVGWDVFAPYCEGPEPPLKECLTILKRITKHNIYVDNLLQILLTKYDKHLLQSADLFGKSLAICDPNTRREMLAKYRIVLENVRHRNIGEYVRVLCHAQMGYNGVCDEKNLRHITDLVLKLDSERPKCLQIISSYITHRSYIDTSVVNDLFESLDVCELITGDTAVDAMGYLAKVVKRMGDQLRRRCVMLVGGYCSHSLVKVRTAAFEVMVEVFEDLFTDDSHSSAKRPKTVMSPILKTSGSKDPYITTILYGVALGVIEGPGDVREKVGSLLTKDMTIRFAECFYLTVYQLLVHGDKCQDVSVCLSALLQMLFSELRSRDGFKRLKLKDEPLTIEQPDGPIKLLTMSKTYQGTFRSQLRATDRHKVPEISTGIDVQISIDSILDTFLRFAMTTPKAAQALFLELMKKLTLEDRVDIKSTWSKLLANVMMKNTLGDLTPTIVEACRVVIEDVSQVEGFESTVAALKERTKNTEGAALTNLLYEEVLLRTRGELLELGSFEDCPYDGNMEAENPFSIEALQATFGKLSNWNQLTIQQKSQIERDLPTLWTSAHAWDTTVGSSSLHNRDGWFQKMLAASRGESKRDIVIWLREMDRWPRRQFEASAVIEAIQYQNDENATLSCNIQDSDCLAEWAARLTIRSARLSEIDSGPNDLMLSHSHELQWTMCANERELPTCALDCIKRNTVDLYENETLAWLEQKVLALRLIGLKRNDSDIMRKALDTAEKYTPLFLDQSPGDVINGMYKLILQLHCDLETLSDTKLNAVLHEVSTRKDGNNSLSQTNRRNLKSIYEMAITHYDHSWSTVGDAEHQNGILKRMSEVLNAVVEHNLSHDVFLSVIFNRLDELHGEIDANTARVILSKLQQIWPTLDQFSIDELKRHLPSFGGVTSEFIAIVKLIQDTARIEQYKLRLQLICDPGHTLLSYCDDLSKALQAEDADQWKVIFDRMSRRIFQNPYIGSDYELLKGYEKMLDPIYEFDTDKAEKTSVLKQIREDLEKRPDQKCLRVSQLCPSLGGDECLRHLLGSHHQVVRIDEQVQVFTDTIRRPCVFRVVLCNGSAKRYLHKSGEQLRVDAAAQRVAATLAQQWGGRVGYKVTPLGEDSGLIEYLEGYERVRSLISENYDIDGVSPRPDGELIVSPRAAEQSFQQLCRGVPAHALRSAVQAGCCTTEDFIAKKLRFQESLVSITILTWLLGVGDRHLQNTLYSRQAGTLCCVDWADVFKYGSAELPPARLTRNFLAVCDLQAFESRLQNWVTSLRQSHKLHTHTIHEAFKWLGRDFLDKKPYIESLLEGKALPHEITKDAVSKSTLKFKEKYIQLLDNVFYRYEKKDYYSVQEQVSNLLQHCTDTRILSVTRSGWEPWI